MKSKREINGLNARPDRELVFDSNPELILIIEVKELILSYNLRLFT